MKDITIIFLYLLTGVLLLSALATVLGKLIEYFMI
jgi:hypothetical protein